MSNQELNSLVDQILPKITVSPVTIMTLMGMVIVITQQHKQYTAHMACDCIYESYKEEKLNYNNTNNGENRYKQSQMFDVNSPEINTIAFNTEELIDSLSVDLKFEVLCRIIAIFLTRDLEGVSVKVVSKLLQYVFLLSIYKKSWRRN